MKNVRIEDIQRALDFVKVYPAASRALKIVTNFALEGGIEVFSVIDPSTTNFKASQNRHGSWTMPPRVNKEMTEFANKTIYYMLVLGFAVVYFPSSEDKDAQEITRENSSKQKGQEKSADTKKRGSKRDAGTRSFVVPKIVNPLSGRYIVKTDPKLGRDVVLFAPQSDANTIGSKNEFRAIMRQATGTFADTTEDASSIYESTGKYNVIFLDTPHFGADGDMIFPIMTLVDEYRRLCEIRELVDASREEQLHNPLLVQQAPEKGDDGRSRSLMIEDRNADFIENIPRLHTRSLSNVDTSKRRRTLGEVFVQNTLEKKQEEEKKIRELSSMDATKGLEAELIARRRTVELHPSVRVLDRMQVPNLKYDMNMEVMHFKADLAAFFGIPLSFIPGGAERSNTFNEAIVTERRLFNNDVSSLHKRLENIFSRLLSHENQFEDMEFLRSQMEELAESTETPDEEKRAMFEDFNKKIDQLSKHLTNYTIGFKNKTMLSADNLQMQFIEGVITEKEYAYLTRSALPPDIKDQLEDERNMQLIEDDNIQRLRQFRRFKLGMQPLPLTTEEASEDSDADEEKKKQEEEEKQQDEEEEKKKEEEEQKKDDKKNSSSGAGDESDTKKDRVKEEGALDDEDEGSSKKATKKKKDKKKDAASKAKSASGPSTVLGKRQRK